MLATGPLRRWTPSLVQAGLGSARDHALASLLALNGLRISEALGADIDDLEYERGHHTLKILRKGGKTVVVPLAPRTSRAVDLYIGERTTGPIFLGAKGERMDRYAADRMVNTMCERSPGSRSVKLVTMFGSSAPKKMGLEDRHLWRVPDDNRT
jgi:integrase